jgi:hypothetical protein
MEVFWFFLQKRTKRFFLQKEAKALGLWKTFETAL